MYCILHNSDISFSCHLFFLRQFQLHLLASIMDLVSENFISLEILGDEKKLTINYESRLTSWKQRHSVKISLKHTLKVKPPAKVFSTREKVMHIQINMKSDREREEKSPTLTFHFIPPLIYLVLGAHSFNGNENKLGQQEQEEQHSTVNFSSFSLHSFLLVFS